MTPETVESAGQDRVTDSAAHRHLAAPEDVVAEALAATYGHGRRNGGLSVVEPASDGYLSARSATPDEAATVAIGALRAAGYRLMVPVCEACDDDGISW